MAREKTEKELLLESIKRAQAVQFAGEELAEEIAEEREATPPVDTE